jgi:hypothetical protein
LSIELRVAIIPTANSLEDAVLRILGGAEPLPLDQVGFPPPLPCSRPRVSWGWPARPGMILAPSGP